MYECPNCGGNLKFDISSQQMACSYCDTHLDPYFVKKETDAVEEQFFEATVFTCPQCGGELYSMDNEATSFCSFCGASTILMSRISKEKRPDFIVPFKKTKEDCKRAYEKKMRKAFFVPRELRDPKYIDGFRGIYMPYWTYQLIQRGSVHVDGEVNTRKGDYIYTDHYHLCGDMDTYYLGDSYDASTSFYDNISEALAPYDAKELVHFTPAFLSGFYADTADVGPEVYLEDAVEQAEKRSFQRIKTENAFKDYEIKKRKEYTPPDKGFKTRLRKADHTMYPVWFLSYRNKEQVAYATVNGQTGKVVVDMPIDPKRYLAVSLLLALPIFLLLNIFFTLKPSAILGISMALVFGAVFMYMQELNAIFQREHNLDDKALNWKKERARGQDGLPKIGKGKTKAAAEKSKKYKLFWRSLWMILGTFFGIFFLAGVSVLFDVNSVLDLLLVAVWPVSVVGVVVCGVKGIRKDRQIRQKGFSAGFIISIAAAVVGAGIGLLRPVSDIYYYAGVIFTLGAVLYNFVDIIRNYNKLAMRKLPQFDKKGGDDRA